MTFTVDSADRLALVNCQQQGLHLWDLESKCKIRQFRGLTAGTYTIHPCFGGVNESFIASGSEDSKVSAPCCLCSDARSNACSLFPQTDCSSGLSFLQIADKFFFLVIWAVH